MDVLRELAADGRRGDRLERDDREEGATAAAAAPGGKRAVVARELPLSLVVLFVVLAVFGPRHFEGLLWLPLLIAVQIVMNLGLAYLLSALDVFYRDVEHILGVVLLAWYFLTPVLFPIAILANRPRELFLLQLNPMTGVIVGYQRALLDGLPPDWPTFGYSAAVALVLFVVGFAYFRRVKDDFEAYL